jgi:hypothetical protein
VVRVQKIRVPDTGHLSWIVVDGKHLPVTMLNEYLPYLHRLGRSPNTVRAYAKLKDFESTKTPFKQSQSAQSVSNTLRSRSQTEPARRAVVAEK